MASFAFTVAKYEFGRAGINLTTASSIRLALLSTNTTADTTEDALTLSGIATLDEFNGANYARKTLTGLTMTRDDPNNRGEFSFADVVFTALGAGARDVQGALIFKFVTNDADSIPIVWVEFTPFNGNGGDVTLQPNVEGVLQFT
jgi:hypothetical protein